MFSKFKSGTTAPQNPIDTNPIVQYFEIGKQTAFAGPELVWKIHDAYKKSDGRVSIPLSLSMCLSFYLLFLSRLPSKPAGGERTFELTTHGRNFSVIPTPKPVGT